ncbi:MAG: hypothetical protein IPI35_35355 [Deltaproteobacteria bacterium]|nr:hypothetical protein [Deltaproteobacteria bacterium]
MAPHGHPSLPGGRELAYGLCVREELGECVLELANDLEREHRRYAEWYGLPKLASSIDNMLLELHRHRSGEDLRHERGRSQRVLGDGHRRRHHPQP